MNPVPMKPMVEAIRGYRTLETTIATARELLASMGKECIVVNDMPGFVSNRVLMLTVNEAVFLLQDQVAAAEEVDKIFRMCFGHAMGPLETADLIGLDNHPLLHRGVVRELQRQQVQTMPFAGCWPVRTKERTGLL